MRERLQVQLNVVGPDTLEAVKRRLWRALETQGYLAFATHFVRGNGSRVSPIEKLKAPLADTYGINLLKGRDLFDGPFRLSLHWRYGAWLELDLSWSGAAERPDCAGFLAAVDVALGERVIWSPGGVAPELKDRSRADPPRTGWLQLPRVLDLFDLRVMGTPELLRTASLPAQVRRWEQGHLLFVQWTESREPGQVDAAMRLREHTLGDLLHWPLDEAAGSHAALPSPLPFPDADRTTYLAPPDVLPPKVEDLLKATGRGHHRKAEKLLAALTKRQVKEALGPMCLVGHADTVEVLIARGADPSFVGTQGWTPLGLATLGRQPELVARLLELGADPSVRFGRDHNTALHVVAMESPAEWRAGVRYYKRRMTETDRETLDRLADAGDRILQLLIAAGAPLDAQNRHGRTPFFHAVSDSRMEMAASLLRAGADPLLRAASSQTAFDLALESWTQKLLELQAIAKTRP